MNKIKIYSSIIIFLISSMIGINILLKEDKPVINIAYALDEISTTSTTTTTTTEIPTTATKTTTSTTTSTTTQMVSTSIKTIPKTAKVVTTTQISNYLTISGTSKKYPLKQGNGSYSDLTSGNKYAVLDNRVTLKDKKVIIYGHSYPNGGGLFNYFQNYDGNESFYLEHPYIEIVYDNKYYKYAIFSVYIQGFNKDVTFADEELEYFNIYNNSYKTWKQTLLKYKNKSQYLINQPVFGDSRIIIIQTCSLNKEYTSKYDRANLLIFATLIESKDVN